MTERKHDGDGEPTASLDWSEARARLERLSGDPTEQDVVAQLDRRTRDLAEPEVTDNAASRVELIAFGRAGLRFAVPVEQTQAVAQLRDLLVLPAIGSPHVGVMVHDGQLYAVIDPAPLINQDAEAASAPQFAILIREAGQSIGLAADALFGVMPVDAAVLQVTPSHYSIVSAILPGGEHVLSPEDIGRNVRLVVDHRQHDTALN